MQQLTSYFIGMFVGVAGIKIGEFLSWIYSRSLQKKQSKEVDILELQRTVNMLDKRSVMQAQAFNERWINVEETARKQKHYINDVLKKLARLEKMQKNK